ncbi:thioredoxin TrxC [Paucibacter sp. TC2R-5]|uniref:thioredoxin TrxC n=1 Tax=Paucibacter sp. TC2R-5 TaxID=2893555 RepID=UPI0021E50943|nr:thioredoxin TrxC [Paucibacter sp. TC2R-5]MCV2359924.1 thioredoxin TrxC [Paucibacter sp. TC2R-5]
MLITCPHCLTKNRVPNERATQDPVCGKCGQALLSGEVVELNDANFDAVVAGSELPVLVDFWAPWCGPCRQMAPQFAIAAQQLKGQVLLVKVNSDESPQLSQRFGIRSIPTLLQLQQGKELQRLSGALQAPQIVAWLR